MGRILLDTNPAVEIGRPSRPYPLELGQAFPFKGPCLTAMHWCIVLEVYSKMFPPPVLVGESLLPPELHKSQREKVWSGPVQIPWG